MEIQLYDRFQDPLAAIKALGHTFSQSCMFGADSASKGEVIALTCFAEKISPLQFQRTYHIVEGRPQKKAMAALAEFRARGGRYKWLATGEDGQRAEAEFTFEGQTVRVAFTIEQARQQGLSMKPGSIWIKSPGNMLRARVSSNAVGMLCPEIYACGDEDDGEAPEPSQITLTPFAPPVTVISHPTAPAPPPPNSEPVTVKTEQNSVAPPIPSVAAPPPAASSLSPETADQLLAAIPGDKQEMAMSWFFENGYLKPGQNIDKMEPIKASKIIKQAASFVRAVENWAKAKQGQAAA